jgi:hypothetical protein
LIYRTSTIQLLDSLALGTADVGGQPRQTLRYQLHPIGQDNSFDFYAYSSHYKSEEGLDNEQRRLVEANAIRADADALGNGAKLIFAGDHNVYRSSEPAIQALLAAGPGQAHDPLNRLGDWSGSPAFADIHTQAPCLSSCGGLTTGGLDDRFDFQFISGELQDGVGLDYLQNSYRAFGNGGNVFNNDVNVGCGSPGGCLNDYAFSGVTSHTDAQILDALHSVTDHLPVVADYTFTGSLPPPEPVVIAKWTFETGTSGNPPAATDSTDITGISPAQGAGTASGHHANAATDWSNPAGNGSVDSLSSNTWTVGDYTQFQVSTEGFADITLAFDATSSGTGPRDFRIDYSVDGANFIPTGETYAVQANSPPIAWDSDVYYSQHSFFFDLSHIEELDDQASLILRLVDTSTVSANGGSVGTSGTSRVDNVTIFYSSLVGLPGDFNADGFVDAADYVMWRKDNSVGAYADWVAHFGESLSGSGGDGNDGSVPEPGTWLLTSVGTCLLAAWRGKLAGWTRQR